LQIQKIVSNIVKRKQHFSHSRIRTMKIETKMLDDFFNEKRYYSRFEAAVYIIKECSKADGKLLLSLGELAEHFQWKHRTEVSRFLAELERKGYLVKTNGQYKLTQKALPPTIERIEVESIDIEMVEIPTFKYQVPIQPEGVPPTDGQLYQQIKDGEKSEILIDLSKIDWNTGMQVPKLRFYKRYIEATNNSYVVQESDSMALDAIVKSMEKQLREAFKAQGKPYHKSELLSAIDRFIENMKSTQCWYFGRSLKTIAEKYNDVATEIKTKMSNRKVKT